MTSPLLALFARSLREDVRSRMTYFARTGLVLVILLFLFSVRETFGWGNAPGLRFFATVIYINFIFIVLAGLSYFASTITEEKEEMTLGLLRMTNLDPLSILLGKSTSRLVGALLLLVAQFPFTLLAISLGGVAVRQILAAYCTLGAFLIFLANLALLASVIFRRSTAAAVFTGLTLFGFFAVVPVLRFFAMIPVRIGWIQTPGPMLLWLGNAADFVAITSPLQRLRSILSTGFADAPVGTQVWTNLALGAGCSARVAGLRVVLRRAARIRTEPLRRAQQGTPHARRAGPRVVPRACLEGLLFLHRREGLDGREVRALRGAACRRRADPALFRGNHQRQSVRLLYALAHVPHRLPRARFHGRRHFPA